MSGHIRNPDPQFPDRPQHPDFWVLSDAVNETDEAALANGIDATISRYIDPESLHYMMQNRVRKAIDTHTSLLEVSNDFVFAGSVWLDAFTAGCEYERRKLERQYGTGKSDS